MNSRIKLNGKLMSERGNIMTFLQPTDEYLAKVGDFSIFSNQTNHLSGSIPAKQPPVLTDTSNGVRSLVGVEIVAG